MRHALRLRLPPVRPIQALTQSLVELSWKPLFILSMIAAPTLAQSPAQRTQLAAWADSLERAGTEGALSTLEAVVAGGEKATRQLRRALYNARRGEVGRDRGALEKALFDFDQASARHRSWPWPELGLTRVFRDLHIGEYLAVGSDGQLQGESHVEAAWRHLRDALKRDATSPDARRPAIELFVAAGDRELPSVQQQAFNRLIAAGTPEADLLLVFGRLLRTRRQFDSSVAAFDRALAAGGDRSRLQLERARTLRSLGDSAGAVAAYWDGARRPSSIGRTAYRTDLAWILPPDSLTGFDAAQGDSLLPWLTTFWAMRDVRSAKNANGRLVEHLRRWAAAYANFRVVAPWRRTMFSRVEFGYEGQQECVSSYSNFYKELARTPPKDPLDIRNREPLLDHRGIIYLRHGEPIGRTERISVTGETGGVQANPPADSPFHASYDQRIEADIAATRAATMAWMYWIDGEWRVLFFRGSKALGTQAPTTLTSFLPLGWTDEWLAVGRMAPGYAEAAAKLSGHTSNKVSVSCLPAVNTAIKTSRKDATLGLATDSDSPPLTHPWNGVLTAYAIGNEREQNGRVLITFALPTDLLVKTRRDNGRLGIDVRFRLSAFNRKNGTSVQIDTVRRFATDSVAGPNQFLSGLFELPLESGVWDLSLLARQVSDSAGAFAEIRNRRITAGTSLAISDLVTGVGSGRPVWSAADAPFPLNVLGTWTRKAPVEVYYEVYGLPPGTAYRSLLDVRPADGKKGKSISIGSTEQARGPTTSVRRTVDIAQLPPGAYRLIVTISHGSESVVSERPLLIVKQ